MDFIVKLISGIAPIFSNLPKRLKRDAEIFERATENRTGYELQSCFKDTKRFTLHCLHNDIFFYDLVSDDLILDEDYS